VFSTGIASRLGRLRFLGYTRPSLPVPNLIKAGMILSLRIPDKLYD